jgi:hypothetical protein
MAVGTDESIRPSPTNKCLLTLLLGTIIMEKFWQAITLLKLNCIFLAWQLPNAVFMDSTQV